MCSNGNGTKLPIVAINPERKNLSMAFTMPQLAFTMPQLAICIESILSFHSKVFEIWCITAGCQARRRSERDYNISLWKMMISLTKLSPILAAEISWVQPLPGGSHSLCPPQHAQLRHWWQGTQVMGHQAASYHCTEVRQRHFPQASSLQPQRERDILAEIDSIRQEMHSTKSSQPAASNPSAKGNNFFFVLSHNGSYIAEINHSTHKLVHAWKPLKCGLKCSCLAVSKDAGIEDGNCRDHDKSPHQRRV